MASESDSQRNGRGSRRDGRECEALAGALGGDQCLGMILATAALNAAADHGVGFLEILGPLAGGAADLVGANHIAAANDHEQESMIVRMNRKLILASRSQS